jgi:septum site-determining protein MinD
LLRIITVSSGKGGVGKTTVVANLGIALREFGQNVILIDADLTTSNLSLHFGMHQFQPFHIQNVLKGEIDIKKAFYAHPSGVNIVPSSLRLGYLDVKSMSFKLKSLLKGMNGIVLIDSAPGLDEKALSVIKTCDDVLVVTNPNIPSIVDATKVIQVARGMKKNVLGVVLNKAEGNKFELKPEEVEMTTEASIISTIPHDKNVKRSLFEKLPVVHYRPYAPAALKFRKLAADLLGVEFNAPRFAGMKRVLGYRSFKN